MTELFAEAKSLMVRQSNPPWKAIIKLEKQNADILKKLGRVDAALEVLRRISSFDEIFLDPHLQTACPMVSCKPSLGYRILDKFFTHISHNCMRD